MEKNVPLSDIVQFIQINGIDAYERCPCEKGDKFKFCCMNNKTNFDKSKLPQKESALYREVWHLNDSTGDSCMFTGCTEKAIGSHSIQRSGPLKLIEPDSTKPIYT